MSEDNEVLLERDGPVATIILNRPDRLNALAHRMRETVAAHVRALDADPDCRVMVLTGAGKAFCAGGDIQSMEAFDDDAAKRTLGASQAMSRTVNLAEKPVIGSIRGACAGGGMSLALACDMRIASETARFTMTFRRIGLVPDIGGMFYLTQLLGLSQAKDLVFSARTVGAAEALELGLVNRVVPDAELESATRAMADELAASAPLALANSKRMLRGLYVPTLEQQLAFEFEIQSRLMLSEDHKEACRAFLEKRPPPAFKGR